MSMIGLIQFRGSTVTVRRSTKTRQSNGTYNQAWSSAIASTKSLLESVTSELAQRIWGQEVRATHRAYFEFDTDVRVGDGVQVSAGAYSNTNYRVTAVLPRDFRGASRYLEVGLDLTTEAFA